MNRIKVRIESAGRRTTHIDAEFGYLTYPGERSGWNGKKRHLRCNRHCRSFWVWSYEIFLDGRLVDHDNCRSPQKVADQARRRACVLAWAIGEHHNDHAAAKAITERATDNAMTGARR